MERPHGEPFQPTIFPAATFTHTLVVQFGERCGRRTPKRISGWNSPKYATPGLGIFESHKSRKCERRQRCAGNAGRGSCDSSACHASYRGHHCRNWNSRKIKRISNHLCRPRGLWIATRWCLLPWSAPDGDTVIGTYFYCWTSDCISDVVPVG